MNVSVIILCCCVLLTCVDFIGILSIFPVFIWKQPATLHAMYAGLIIQ